MPSEKGLWLEDGKREYKRKNYSEAINYFNHQIRDNVRDSEAWYFKGKAWLKLNKLSEAQSCFQKVCDIDTGSEKGWAHLGDTLMGMDRLEEALDTYTSGIGHVGNSAILWLGKSRVFIMIGANQKANEALDKALDIDPNLGEAWLEKLHISPYEPATRANPTDPQRRRKLLLHRTEIDRMDSRVTEKGFTLIPLTVYFRRGRAKVELALARGKHRHDKRETIKRREGDREARRAMRRHTR